MGSTIPTATTTATTTVTAVTATTTAAATEAAATTTAATATAAFFTRTCFVDDQTTAAHILTVEHLNSLLGFFTGAHFYETKSARAAGFTIIHNGCFDHGARLGEMIDQLVFNHGVREVPDIQTIRHKLT